ncbi:MAG: FAD-dependent oxidoreductase [Coriobacteriales bacterium]|jgi:fumarate reductase flavoprotein subunit|nr:FAD-dependent oxidoreductase [Coriobacteriales bacterium]
MSANADTHVDLDVPQIAATTRPTPPTVDDASAGDPVPPTATDWLGKPPDLKPEDCAAAYQADVIIVGSALAGEFAAYSAILEGASVIVLERNSTAHIGGSGIGFVNSRFQLEQGQPRQDEYQVIQTVFNQLAARCDLSLLSQWVFYSGAVLDELVEQVLEPAGFPARVSVQTPYPDRQRELLQSLNSHVNFDPSGRDSLEDFNFMMHNWLKSHGCQMHFNTTARVLTQDADGRVTGLIASDESGRHIHYSASKGVVVCSGSYGANDAMMAHFAPPFLARFAKRYGWYNARISDKTPITATEPMDDGQGHKMLCWAGAAMEEIDPSYQSWFSTGYNWWPYLAVDASGRRFQNESVSWLAHTHLLAELPEGSNYYWQIRPTNDFTMPITLPFNADLAVWHEKVKQTSEWHEANSIAELAVKIGVDPETLVQTVERYNANCAAGFDRDWGKLPKYLDPIDDPPYVAVKSEAFFYCTSSGVKCNDKMEVLDKDWQPIPGLFAAGNTVGWRLGSGYQMAIPGLCNAYALFHGYLAGKSSANSEWAPNKLKT